MYTPGKNLGALPDLSKHNNIMAEVLRSQPDLYWTLNGKQTKLGVTIDQCIKTGIDNPSHPFIKTCGIVAGDEESYDTFSVLFDPIISRRHDIYTPADLHIRDTNTESINEENIDPSGKYVISSRVRTGRSIRGFRFSPTISFEERRSLEKVVVQSLSNLTGLMAGDYYPLHGSLSFEAKSGGMTSQMEGELRSKGQLFQGANSSPLLISSGMYRDWPDARGVFINGDRNLFVWLNEEDHIRIISMETGSSLQSVFKRFASFTNAINSEIRKLGFKFAYNDRLGNVLVCPSNIGTGLRVGCHIRIPLLSVRPEFKSILAKMDLQARGCDGVDSESRDGIVDISNSKRIGQSEVQLVNSVIEGISRIIFWEEQLEKGKALQL